MNAEFRSYLFLLLVAILVVACAPQQTTDASTEPPPPNVTEPSPTVHGDPTEAQASLMNALQEAGAQVELGDPIEQIFFSVPGRILKVDEADVQVFEYESPEAMETDAAQVAPDGGSVGTSMVTWMATPHFFKSGRMIVLYVGDDAAVLDLLERALGEQFAGR